MEENQQTTGVGTHATEKNAWGKRVSSKRVALVGLFVALSYAVSWWEIPLPLFGASFLKLDFGNVFIVLLSFLLGPLEAIFACFLKEGLRCISSSSLCAGELANFVVTSAYLVLPSIVYCYKKTLKTVLLTLAIGCVLATGTALLANRFLIFPCTRICLEARFSE